MTAAVEVMEATQARAITDRIKVGVEACWELIKQAYTQRAWDALGYDSWDDYCTREFGTSRLRLPREDRSEVVSSLRESGLSIRAIAAATGDSRDTVHKALNSRVRNLTSDTADVVADALAEELIAEVVEPESAPVIGLDGKRYQPIRPQPAPAHPRREALSDSFAKAAVQLGKTAAQIEALCDDDRFSKNKDQIALRVSDLVRARDALQRVIDRFGN